MVVQAVQHVVRGVAPREAARARIDGAGKIHRSRLPLDGRDVAREEPEPVFQQRPTDVISGFQDSVLILFLQVVLSGLIQPDCRICCRGGVRSLTALNLLLGRKNHF